MLHPPPLLARPLSTTLPRPSPQSSPKTLLEDSDNGFSFIRHNPRPPKPRRVGVTETRGRYHSAMGLSYLSGMLKTMGAHIDGPKFAGGSFSLFPELAHAHGVYASTGERQRGGGGSGG